MALKKRVFILYYMIFAINACYLSVSVSVSAESAVAISVSASVSAERHL
jgi:hypothetical protein